MIKLDIIKEYKILVDKLEEKLLGLNIFYRGLEEKLPMGRDLSLFFHKNIAGLRPADLKELLAINMHMTKSLLFKTNQYINYTEKLNMELKLINLKYLKSLFETSDRSLDLFLGLESIYQEELIASLGSLEEIRQMDNKRPRLDLVPCSEYSPREQIRIMKLDLDKLKEPILDLGCGYNGNLVKYLSSKGKDIYGMDRFVEDDPRLFSGSWLDYDFKEEKYGTIISHMAFSNHFNREHLKKNGLYIEYAKKYMEILNSLKKSGSFYYTPGLEFIEDILPEDRYSLESFPIEYFQGQLDKFVGIKITAL